MHPFNKAYTFLELIACIAIISILCVLALPAWQKIIDYHKTVTTTQQLLHTLNYARQYALLHRQPLIICPTYTPPTQCGENWQLGWNIFTAQYQLIRHINNLSGLSVRWQNLRHNSQLNITLHGTAEGSNGTFYYGHAKLIINRAARARLQD